MYNIPPVCASQFWIIRSVHVAWISNRFSFPMHTTLSFEANSTLIDNGESMANRVNQVHKEYGKKTISYRLTQ